jgi:hypothetical protein
MAAPDEALKAQIANWFAAVDPTMRQVLETIYAEAPAAVSKAISGGAWVADEGDPPLAEVIGGGDFTQQAGLRYFGFECDPWPLAEGFDANLKWSIQNGSTPHPAFTTNVKIVAPDGSESTAALEAAPFEPGQVVDQTFRIPSVISGTYLLTVDANPEGAPEGGPPSERGTRLYYPDIPISVATAEAAAGEQASTGLASARAQLTALVSGLPWRDAREKIESACNYLAGVDTLSEEQLTIPAALSSAAASAEDNGTVFWGEGEDRQLRPQVDEALTAAGVAATRLDITVSPPKGLDELLAALTDLTTALSR